MLFFTIILCGSFKDYNHLRRRRWWMWRIRRWRIRRRMRERRKSRRREVVCEVASCHQGRLPSKHSFTPSLCEMPPPPLPEGSMGGVWLRKARLWFHQMKQLWFQMEDSDSWCHLKSCPLSLLDNLLSRSSCGWLTLRCLLHPWSALSWLRPL